MVSHSPSQGDWRERLEVPRGGGPLLRIGLLVGAIGLAAALVAGLLSAGGLRRFYFAYLASFLFYLTIGLGAVFFVLVQHVSRAGWSVVVRRSAEAVGATMPVMAALSLPILIAVATNGGLYPWAASESHKAGAHQAGPASQHSEVQAKVEPTDKEGGQAPHGKASGRKAGEGTAGEHGGMTHSKQVWLSRPFFIVRILAYLGIWSAMGIWYWKQSVAQDQSGEARLTRRMEAFSAPGLLLLGITLTLASFDLVMSLDPHWYSTIFGVYLFSGSAVGIFAALIVILAVLQRYGLLLYSVTREHYHDLGKYLFGFVFFWGYIAFSQYMLIWYANIPEEKGWFLRRGATTAEAFQNGWSIVSVLLLFGHLLIPFAGLLSRHVKRDRTGLVFWAIWMLAFHWVDMIWLTLPELDGRFYLGLPEIGTLVGLGGLFTASLAWTLGRASLRPMRDPRLEEALVFVNI